MKPEPIDDDLIISLNFQHGVCLTQTEEPSDYVYEIGGGIDVVDEGGDGQTIGKLTMFMFDIAKGVNAGFDPFTIIDSWSQESYEYGQAIYGGSDPMSDTLNGSYELSEAASDLTEGGSIDRILVLNTMRINPEWRGHQIGLKGLHAATLMYGHASFVIMKPWPLVEEGQPKLSPAVRRKGQLKLQKYWKRLGFQRMGKSDFFGMYHPEDNLQQLNDVL